ncbi:hypothetical protein CF327_g4989 [Tilletia walkeri]|nr:hypothetical protein CF327_g4989 [Tilletia walkeri]
MDGSRRAEGDESYKEGPPDEKIFFPPSTISSSSLTHIHLSLLTPSPLVLNLFILYILNTHKTPQGSVFPAVVHGLSTLFHPSTSSTVAHGLHTLFPSLCFLSAALFCHRRASLFHPNPCLSDNIYAPHSRSHQDSR